MHGPSVRYGPVRSTDFVIPKKGQITCWDVFNEPLHGDVFAGAFGQEIWNEIFERVKVIYFVF